MEKRHYVCVKDSDDAVVVLRTDPSCRLQRALFGSLGAALFWHGARRKGLLAVAASMVGADLLSRSMTGKSILTHVREAAGPASAHTADAPSFHDQGIAASQEPADDIDEASMASFPASDPPAYHRHEMNRTDPTSSQGDSNVNGQ